MIKRFPPLSHLRIDYSFIAVTGEPRKLDISWPSQEFYDICRHSPGYNEDSMNVSIKHIRKWGAPNALYALTDICPPWATFSFELPDDVFYEGQLRPTKANKKPKKRAHAAMASGDSVSTQPNLRYKNYYSCSDVLGCC